MMESQSQQKEDFFCFFSTEINFVDASWLHFVARESMQLNCCSSSLRREAAGTPQSPAHSGWLPCLVSSGFPFLLRDTQLFNMFCIVIGDVSTRTLLVSVD